MIIFGILILLGLFVLLLTKNPSVSNEDGLPWKLVKEDLCDEDENHSHGDSQWSVN